MEDTGGRGGIYGKPGEMFLTTGDEKVSLAGAWKYEVEKNYSAASALVFSDISIGEQFVTTYRSRPSTMVIPDTENPTPAGDQTVIRIKALQNEMKYDLKTFTVEAGRSVVIIFENPDFMQHNLVITRPGTMTVVGRAADKLATDAKGASMQYVPDIPEVLYHTPLVNPQETIKLEFVAPAEPGDYPYVCTFPGHWSIMNGVMRVTKTKTAL
jgi:azurin